MPTFWLLMALYIVPLWCFPHVPTQDGISHVYNTVILRDFGEPSARYDEAFAIRREQFPNWSAHLLLWGLGNVFSPQIAEKILVSLYVVGTASAICLLFRAVNLDAAASAPAALLFLYHRGFFMGFYGFCLSVMLFWFVTAVSALWRGELNVVRSVTLAALFLITYFTHLIGFVLALISAALISLMVSRRPLNSLVCVAIAAIPSLLLTADYLARSHVAVPSHLGAWQQLIGWQMENLSWTHVGNELWQVNDELFGVVEPFTQPVLGAAVLLLLEVIALSGLLLGKRSSVGSRTDTSTTRGKWALIGLSLIVGTFYFVLPDQLVPHGSFLQLRWIAIPPILWLACCRLPEPTIIRRSVIAAIWIVSAGNLVAVNLHFRRCNAELAEYCSGIEASGVHNLLVPVQPPSPELVDHLSHAACYYCLTTGNVLVDNYEAYNPHFPVRFLHLPARRSRTVDEYISEFHPEVLVCWKDDLQQLRENDRKHYREVFRQGHLSIARRISLPE